MQQREDQLSRAHARRHRCVYGVAANVSGMKAGFCELRSQQARFSVAAELVC